MKIYKNPKRYHFSFDDHSFGTNNPLYGEDIDRIIVDPVVIDITGWLLVEDKRALIVASSREKHGDKYKYDEIWTIVKVKGLTKVLCND